VIPRAHITAWRSRAPWPTNEQVEQDLVLSRALVEIFNRKLVANQAIFRGGTALHKLFFSTHGRYSEDIDLVQREAQPIGPFVDTLREVLDPWLGDPQWKQGKDRFALYYRFETTFAPVTRMRLKIEINTRDHFSVLGTIRKRFTVENPWFTGSAMIPVFRYEELLGTKMRALYQRRKGRDLYDLWIGLQYGDPDRNQILHCFDRYMKHDGAAVSRAEYEANFLNKLRDPVFLEDIKLLVMSEVEYETANAAKAVHRELIARLPGEPWKGI